jgi:hypothetical protein
MFEVRQRPQPDFRGPCQSSGGQSPASHRGGPGSIPGHVGLVVYKVELGKVFSKYFAFPWQFSFHRLLHTHRLSSVAGTIGQLVAEVPGELSLIPPQDSKKEKLDFYIYT